MKRLATLILAGALFVAAPVATAPAQVPPIAQAEQNNNDDDDFPYGLLGLLGLAGLAGLKKRDDHHDTHRTPGSTTTGR